MKNENNPDSLIRELKNHEEEAGKSKLEFSALSDKQLQAARGLGKPSIISVSWMGEISAGAWMYYAAQVHNFGETIGSQMNITTFFGVGALAANPIEAMLVRDPIFPTINSEMFNLEIGQSKRIRIGHRVDHPVREGFYMLNFLFWELNNYDRQADIFSRYHVRFRVV